MSFSKWWFERRRANPSLNDEETKMTISVAEFRRQQERAYKAGHIHGVSERPGKDDLVSQVFGNMSRK